MDKENSEEISPKKIDSGRVIAGLIVLGVGVVFFFRQLGVEFPSWLISWPMLLIVLGFVLGAKDNFRGFGWIILVLTGGLFLAGRLYPELNLKPYFWPVIIIAVGLYLILTSLRR